VICANHFNPNRSGWIKPIGVRQKRLGIGPARSLIIPFSKQSKTTTIGTCVTDSDYL